MKKILACMVIVTASASLMTGCSSTNTQSQNTALGAAGGAVVGGVASGVLGGNPVAIGVSAIAGALVGGYIGHNMDSSDSTSFSNTLLSNKKNMPTHWTNPKTGVVYDVTPTSDRMTINGNPNCRNYKATATIHGKKHTRYGTACLQSDGTWVKVKH